MHAPSVITNTSCMHTNTNLQRTDMTFTLPCRNQGVYGIPITLVLWVSDVSLWSEHNVPLWLLFEPSLWLQHGCLGPCAMCYISFSDHSLCTITGPNIMALVAHYLSNDKCAKYCTNKVYLKPL